jgi:hypothetical protein
MAPRIPGISLRLREGYWLEIEHQLERRVNADVESYVDCPRQEKVYPESLHMFVRLRTGMAKWCVDALGSVQVP